MGIPDHLLTTEATLVRPASSTDAYNNTTYDYGDAATRTDLMVWLQQDKRTEPISDGRAPLVGHYLLMCNHEDVRGRDQFDIGAVTYQVEGPPEAVRTPGGYHHTEATLKVVNG